MAEILDRRALLERQMLLRRREMSASDAIEHLDREDSRKSDAPDRAIRAAFK